MKFLRHTLWPIIADTAAAIPEEDATVVEDPTDVDVIEEDVMVVTRCLLERCLPLSQINSRWL